MNLRETERLLDLPAAIMAVCLHPEESIYMTARGHIVNLSAFDLDEASHSHLHAPIELLDSVDIERAKPGLMDWVQTVYLPNPAEWTVQFAAFAADVARNWIEDADVNLDFIAAQQWLKTSQAKAASRAEAAADLAETQSEA